MFGLALALGALLMPLGAGAGLAVMYGFEENRDFTSLGGMQAFSAYYGGAIAVLVLVILAAQLSIVRRKKRANLG